MAETVTLMFSLQAALRQGCYEAVVPYENGPRPVFYSYIWPAARPNLMMDHEKEEVWTGPKEDIRESRGLSPAEFRTRIGIVVP